MPFTVRIGEEAHEVEKDAIEVPDGFVLMTQSALDSTIEGRVARERSKHEGKASKGELLEDDEFFQQAASKRGIKLGDDLQPVARLSEEQVRQIREQVRAEEVDPLKKDLDTFKKEAEAGRTGNLIRDIMQVAPEVGVKQTRLRTIFEGETPEFIDRIAGRAEWDPDKRTHFFRDGNGNPIYDDSGRYAGPKKYLEMLRKQDTDNVYFEDRRPGSSGFDNGARGGKRTWRTSEIAEMSDKEYEANREDIQKAQAEGRIVEG